MSTSSRNPLVQGYRRRLARRLAGLPLSTDPHERGIEMAFLDRIARQDRVRLDELSGHVHRLVEDLVDELDEGLADAVAATQAPALEPAPAQRFDEVREFSVRAWSVRPRR